MDFINSLIAPERLARSGPRRCHSTQFNVQNIGKSIASFSVQCATCHWHVARDLTNLVIAAERLISFGPDRRHSTQGNEGKVVESISGCSRNGKWHVPLARAIQLDKIASRIQTFSPIETGKTAFDSSLREKGDKSVALRFVKGDLNTYIKVAGSNPRTFNFFFDQSLRF